MTITDYDVHLAEEIVTYAGYTNRQQNEHFSHLLKRKGIYPYSYVTSFQTFEEKELPLIQAFTNSLTGEPISEEDYDYAQLVWQETQCNDFGDYHDVYLTVDALVLACV